MSIPPPLTPYFSPHGDESEARALAAEGMTEQLGQGRADPATTWALHSTQGESLWRQLHMQLVGKLQQGVWKAGQTLPSERDLAEQLGVSRITVKRSYDELRRTGWISSGSGRGGSTVLHPTPKLQAPLGQLKGFTQEMQEQGKKARTRILLREVVRDRMIASIFGLPSNSSFLHLVRLRFGDDTPMTRENAWYDLGLAPSMVDWDGMGSAYELLRQQCGLTLEGADQTVEAVLSTEEEARDFGLAEPLPCLLFKRHTRVSPSKQLVEYAEGMFRGDIYVYRMPLSI
ncbi:hypothetical protein B9Z51_05695 [Limnohabitans sp. T6-5]|uniref:GntR family transcriptional regulator n=1 Tax=Limnohabitans sp. T6-5 TaxID=1100724 RepID=UPI000D38DE1C|nr:GntR family transcriptional regulator [Limnohabitans sp. T6-5]PUE11763.1 hypothetical protein B9Z51_05695 [Limnohabitans sp. T6-5]